jgi:hypothetical protein
MYIMLSVHVHDMQAVTPELLSCQNSVQRFGCVTPWQGLQVPFMFMVPRKCCRCFRCCRLT